MIQRKIAEYIKLTKYMSVKDIIKLLTWILGLEDVVKVKVGNHELVLSEDISRGEGIWRVKVLVRALDQNISMLLDYSHKKLVFQVSNALFEEPLAHYGFLVLHYATLLSKHSVRLENDMALFPDGLCFKYPRSDPVALSVLAEIFVDKQWSFLNVKNKVVIDVGAYIGDSAIYFVRRGARKVICFEPHPLLYRYLIENIKLNKCEDKVVALNYAIPRRRVLLDLLLRRVLPDL